LQSSASDAQQLFMGNLPHNCTEEDLVKLFGAWGKVIKLFPEQLSII
jgi:RNA recognition motif-containing protein